MHAFCPNDASTVNIDTSSSSQSIQVSTSVPSGQQVRVMNNGSATAWIRFGSTAPTVTLAAGMPVGPGVTEVFTVNAGPIWAAAIAAGSTGKIYFTPGSGV
jgi:hypothetical protein